MYQISNLKFSQREIIKTNKYLITWKRDEKRINYWLFPLDFEKELSPQKLYESSEYLKSVKRMITQTRFEVHLQIVDESNFIRKIKVSELNEEQKNIHLDNDDLYFVHKNFTGNEPNFTFCNNIVYATSTAYWCDNNRKENNNLALSINSTNLGINLDRISDVFPVISWSWVVYFGQKYNPENCSFDNVNQLVILPEYNKSDILNRSPSHIQESIKTEFFFYHNEDYIIYLWENFSK